jgi:PQQ-dependent catabolism-associated CXXCW motif protein
MLRSCRLFFALAFLGLAACQANQRPEVATGNHSTLASTLRCAPYVGATPTAVAGAKVVDAAGVSAMMNSARPPILLDVATGQERRSLPGSVWLPGAGACDRENPRVQARLEARVAELTGADKGRPLVVFCASRNCWLSYNAALRLAHAGYTDLAWFRDGTEGWQRSGRGLVRVESGW